MFLINFTPDRLPFTAVVLYILFIPTYLIIYVSTVLMSPSRRLLQLLDSKKHVEYDQLLRELNGEDLINSRLEELLASQCVHVINDHYALTKTGHVIYFWLMVYQNLSHRRGNG